MVLCAGGVPVFADIERDTCNIDAAVVERLLDDNTGAVLATHFYGLACDIRRLRELCARRGVALVEDAAQAFGTLVDGQAVGTFGDAGVYSFGLFKNVTTFLGGAVVTRHADVARDVRAGLSALPPESLVHLLRRATAGLITDVATHRALFPHLTYPLLRQWSLRRREAIARGMAIDTHPIRRTAMPARYLHRMRPFQARLAQRQFARVGEHAAARVDAAVAYHRGLHDIPELILPPLRTDGSHTYHYFAVQAEDRVGLVRHAIERGRDLAVSHHKNCADMECFAPFATDCPNARHAAKSVVYLPTYPGYGIAEVERTVAAIRSFYGR
jgi:dTDP-4-amino-4,6-dideoxygalactose transaminase